MRQTKLFSIKGIADLKERQQIQSILMVWYITFTPEDFKYYYSCLLVTEHTLAVRLLKAYEKVFTCGPKNYDRTIVPQLGNDEAQCLLSRAIDDGFASVDCYQGGYHYPFVIVVTNTNAKLRDMVNRSVLMMFDRAMRLAEADVIKRLSE